MRFRFGAICFLLGLACLCPSPANAGLITIGPQSGGNATSVLSDWGITIPTTDNGGNNGGLNNAWGVYDEHPNDLVVYEGHVDGGIGGFSFDYSIEDYVASGGMVGPRYGDQNYDAEILGIGVDMGRLVVAIVSGQRPDNSNLTPPKLYAPGDLYITTDSGVFGVELTGKTFDLDGSGYTIADNLAAYAAGTVVKNDGETGWILAEPNLTGSDYTAHPALKRVQIEYNETANTIAGTAELYFSGNSSELGQHSVFELAINLSVFQGAAILGVHWSPSCGNDLLYPSGLDIQTVPEPSSWALFVLGLLGCGVFARRRKLTVNA